MKLPVADPSLIVFFFSFVAANFDAAYYRSSSDGEFKDYKNWMERLPDDTLLSEVAMPGTHDSSTFTSIGGYVQTQARTFPEQFKDGIRFFDIRIRHIADKFALHHGSVFLDNFFGTFLNEVYFFLRDNPSETIIFRLKEDHSPENNSRGLAQTLVEYLFEKDIHSKYVNTNNLRGPIKLKDVRGKFIVFSNMLEFNSYGMPYGGRYNFDIQDDYDSFAVWELNDKFEKVREQIDNARNGAKSKFYLNYLSAAHWTVPPLRVAGGGWIPGFDGMNTLTRNYLRDHPRQFPRQRSTGIIMADFPGTDLIKHIINDNFQGNKRF